MYLHIYTRAVEYLGGGGGYGVVIALRRLVIIENDMHEKCRYLVV